MSAEIIICTAPLDVEQALRASGVGKDELRVTVCATQGQLVDKLSRWKRRANHFVMKQREGKRILRREEIVCCKAAGHRYVVHLSGGEEVVSTTKRCPFTHSMEPLLRDPRFLQCSSSAVVNLDYVREFRDARLILADGEAIPFPAKWQRLAAAALVQLDWEGSESSEGK